MQLFTGELQSIPSGKQGVIETLRLMRKLVREGKKRLKIRLFALSLTSGLQQKDWKNEVSSVFNYVRDGVRYVRDIRGVETLQAPEQTMLLRQGDCDDKSVLIASLLESVGYRTRFRAVAFRSAELYSHVFPEVLVDDQWLALETTEPEPMGWRPGNIRSSLVIYN